MPDDQFPKLPPLAARVFWDPDTGLTYIVTEPWMHGLNKIHFGLDVSKELKRFLLFSNNEMAVADVLPLLREVEDGNDRLLAAIDGLKILDETPNEEADLTPCDK